MKSSMTPGSMAAADLPPEFHAKAIRALDEFEAAAAEYVVLLETQRALIVAGEVDAAAPLFERGDLLARTAAACGRRLGLVREAIGSNQYFGLRTSDVANRLAAIDARAARVSDAAVELAALCAASRATIVAELSSVVAETTPKSASINAYRAFERARASLDVSG